MSKRVLVGSEKLFESTGETDEDCLKKTARNIVGELECDMDPDDVREYLNLKVVEEIDS